MEASNLKIVMTGHGRGEVFLNGNKVQNVTGVDLSAVAGERNQVVIYVAPDLIEVEGEFDVTNIESIARDIVRGPFKAGT